HPRAPFFTKRIREPARRLVASITAHFKIARLAAGSVFDQPQQRRATRRPAMGELDPGKVVEVAVLARDQKARRDNYGLLVLVAVDMDIACALGMIGIIASLKQAAVE